MAFGVPLVAGCPKADAEGKYNSFVDETEDDRADAANVKMDMGGSLADISGTFLFALRANLSEYPLQFYATVTFTPEGDGGKFSMDLQPLSLNVKSYTEPRQPVGEILSLDDVVVSAAGAFEAVTTTELHVIGTANPITAGDITVDPGMKLTGVIQSADIFCGTIDGMVTAPIPLALSPGSTFAAQRVDSIDALPTTIIKKCPEPGDGGTSSGTTTDGPGSSSTTDASTSTTDASTSSTGSGSTTDATGSGTTDGTSGGSTTAG